MKRIFIMLSSMMLLALIGITSLSGCGSITPATDNDKQNRDVEVQGAIQEFKTIDPDMQKFFDTAYGYAVFPDVGSGGLIVGGAGGNGEVFQQGQIIGYCQMAQGNIGAQIGGQSFAEIIFFQDAANLASFKAGQTAFDARVTAVAAGAGKGKVADYQDGVIVFTKPKMGLMAQAAVGGQSFTFVPLSN